MAGVKDIRAAVEAARAARAQPATPTVLFLDEVHRFNKAQQDTFLPFVEDGTLTFIGATTENPSFEVVSALLSRARVYVLRPLTVDDICDAARAALTDRGARSWAASTAAPSRRRSSSLRAPPTATRAARSTCWSSPCGLIGGIAGRRSVLHSGDRAGSRQRRRRRRFDKGGDQFYDQISALHKAVRGTDPDAALYWLCRMLDGGCDPLYIARRVVRMAVEDIGLADPRAFAMTLDAWEAYDRLGSPGGRACDRQCRGVSRLRAKEQRGVRRDGRGTRADVEQFGTLDVPLRFRNAPTGLMKDLGFGRGYRYAHDEPDAFAAGERYLPDEHARSAILPPGRRGDWRSKIGEALGAGCGLTAALRESVELQR